ncbi:hypothetical protein PMAYCL1PPCAC_09991, partial [Pristionchus mayeri]
PCSSECEAYSEKHSHWTRRRGTAGQFASWILEFRLLFRHLGGNSARCCVLIQETLRLFDD